MREEVSAFRRSWCAAQTHKVTLFRPCLQNAFQMPSERLANAMYAEGVNIAADTDTMLFFHFNQPREELKLQELKKLKRDTHKTPTQD